MGNIITTINNPKFYLNKNYGYRGKKGDEIIVTKFDEDLALVYGSPKGSSEEYEYEQRDIIFVPVLDKKFAKGTTVKGLPTKQQVFNYWNNQINKDPKKVGGYWDSTMLDINSTLMSENAIQHFGVYTEKGETEIEEDIYDWGSEFHYDWEQKNKNYAKGTTIEGGKLGKYIVNGTIKIKREEGGYDTERVNGSVMANNKDEAENIIVAYYENRYGTSESEMEVDLMVSNIFAKGTTVKGGELKVGDIVSTPKFNNGKILKIHTFKKDEKLYERTLKKGESLYEVRNLDLELPNDSYAFMGYELTKKMAKGTTIKFDKLPKNRQADKNYDYFAVGKIDGKIVDGWEIVDDVESLKYYAKIDLKDNDYNPKNFNIVSAKYLIRKGINPFDYNNWRKIDYSTNESAYATKFLEGEIYANGGGITKKPTQSQLDKMTAFNLMDAMKNDKKNYQLYKKQLLKLYPDAKGFSNGGGIDENDIKQGDYVDFESYGEFYVCNPSYSDNYFWVTKEKEDRYDSNAQGYSVPKSSAIEIIETDEEYADGGGIKAIFSKEGIEASNPFAFKKKLEFAKKHPELLMLETGGKIEVGDTIYRAFFTDDDGELSSILIKANSREEAEKKADIVDDGDMRFTYVSNPIKIKNEEQLFEETRENEPIYRYNNGGGVGEFNYNPKIDYLSEYHLLPKKVQDIIFKEEYEDSTYESNNKLIKELNGIGWTADYDLSASIYDLKPIDKYAKGNTIEGFVGGVNPEYLLKLSNYQIVGDIIKTLNKDNTEELDLALTYYVDELYDRFDWENDVFEYQSENDQIGYEDLVDIIAIRTNKSKSEIKDIFNSNIAISEKYAKGNTIEGEKSVKISGFPPIKLSSAKILYKDFEENFNSDLFRFVKHYNSLHKAKNTIADYKMVLEFGSDKKLKISRFEIGGKIDNGYFNNCFLKSIFGV